MDEAAKTTIRDSVRTFNKYVLNPGMRLLAGRQHWYAAVIRHTGRRSGRAYATPVVAEPVDDGFIIPLPYGTGVDWLQNIVSSGRATILSKGQEYQVSDPQVIDAATAAPQLPARRRHVFQRFGIDRFVRLQVVQPHDRDAQPI